MNFKKKNGAENAQHMVVKYAQRTFPICLKTGISNTLFTSSKLGDDISQIACAPEMLPVIWQGWAGEA